MRHQKIIGLTFALLAVWGLALNKTLHADNNSVAATQKADKTNNNRFKGGELHHQIRTYLSSMKDIQGERKESLPEALTQIIIVNQPKSGDFLLSLIAQHNNKLRRRAINAFIQTWNTMNLQQIDGFIRHAIELKIDCGKRYPEALRTLIEVEYSSVDGWGGMAFKT